VYKIDFLFSNSKGSSVSTLMKKLNIVMHEPQLFFGNNAIIADTLVS